MKKFNEVAFIGEGWNVKQFKLWEGQGKRRIYINREDGKKSYGFIDLQNQNILVCDSDLKCTLEPIVNLFLESYEIN